MRVVLANAARLLVSIPREKLVGMSNAVNAICNGVDIDPTEFESRLGLSREELVQILDELRMLVNLPGKPTYDTLSVWADGASVQVRAITVHGDPIDMGTEQAREFASEICDTVKKAES